MVQQLLAGVERAVRIAERMGAQTAEGFGQLSETREILLERGQLAAGEERDDLRLIVRAQVKRSLGVGFSSSLDPVAVRTAAEQALRSAASLPAVGPRWAGFPPIRKGQRGLSLRGRWRDDGPSFDLLVQGARRLREGLGAHDALRIVAGGVRGTRFSVAVASSTGLRAAMTRSKTFAYVETVGRSGAVTTPACRAFAASSRGLPDVEGLAEEARSDALLGVRRVPVGSETAPVIFGPHALAFGDLGLMSYLFAGAISAEHLLRGRSALRSARGQIMASEAITITEEGPAREWAGARPVDDEGMPTSRQSIIRAGRFLGFLSDFETASALGQQSTGNGCRDLATGAISIHPHSLRLRPGRKHLEELIGSLRHGYLIKALQGTHGGSPHSGEFTAVCSQAYAIRDGALVGGVQGLALASNLFTILRRVEAVGAEQRDCDGTVVAPILVRSLRLTAKG